MARTADEDVANDGINVNDYIDYSGGTGEDKPEDTDEVAVKQELEASKDIKMEETGQGAEKAAQGNANGDEQGDEEEFEVEAVRDHRQRKVD
jgi:hypothetical protein